MAVFFDKRWRKWVYDFQRNNVRHQGYCLDADGKPVTSRSAAVQAEGVEKRRAQIAPKLAAGNRTTIADVVADLQPAWKRQADWGHKKRAAREILQFFGPAAPIITVGARIPAYIEHALAQPIRVWTGGPGFDRDDEDAEAFWRDTGKTRTNATVNRYLAVLRLILARAGEMRDPVTQEPILAVVPAFDDLPEPRRKARPTPEPVLARLLEILPPHVIDAVVITLYFGFRRSEAFGLCEDQIDWHAQGIRLYAEDVKDDEDAFLPGSQEAMGYLRALAMEAEARGVRHLISYRKEVKAEGKMAQPWRPIRSPKRAWATAMKTIEAEFGRRWRWHDLRAAFITHVAMTSGPVAAQKLARHSDYETTRAYVDVADEVTRTAAERIAARPALRIVGGKEIP